MKTVNCCVCGMDITQTMKFYDNKANTYCYDCFEETFPKKKITRESARNSMERRIKNMYLKGAKPSHIAETLGCSKKKVYEVICK